MGARKASLQRSSDASTAAAVVPKPKSYMQTRVHNYWPPAVSEDRLPAVVAHVRKFAEADDSVALTVLLYTVVFYFGSYNLLTWCDHGILPRAAYGLVRGLVLHRVFVIVHDCAHGAFFTKLSNNYAIGTFLAGLSYIPFRQWRRGHLENHHDFLGMHEENPWDNNKTVFWTTRQWKAMPTWLRALLRVGRDPFVFFPLFGYIMYALLGTESPIRGDTRKSQRRMHKGPSGRLTTYAIKGAEVALCCWLFGARRFLRMEMGVAGFVAQLIGVALHHWQHHVNPPYRVPREHYNPQLAALLGSSCLLVPWWLRWASIGLQYHNIHHLCARVPCYKLQECHDSAPKGMWDGVVYVNGWRALHALFNVQYNEDTGLYEPFPEYRPLLKRIFPNYL